MKNFLMLKIVVVFLSACTTSSDDRKSIAILTPVSHPSLQEIERGFKEEMEKMGSFRFVTYNAQGNKTLMRSEIEEIAQQDYALVFSIGTSASQMVAEVFSKKNLPVPIVFTCVNHPVEFNIVTSEAHPGKNVTGVKELLRFEEELAALLHYKPSIKNVLLVYNPSQPGLQKDQEEVARLLQEKNINLQTVEVFQSNEMLSKSSAFFPQADAVIVLKDNTVVSSLDVLIKLCDRYKIPLMASDLDSPARGAAFGYGVHEVEFGIEGAKKAGKILFEDVSPGSIPVTPVSNFKLEINQEAAKRQGVDL